MVDQQSSTGQAPVSMSPLATQGKSLKEGTANARRGLASAIADIERSSDQAKVLHNLQMHRKRYIWSSRGIGFLNDNVTPLNAGAKILDFGKFIDGSGILHLLAQAGTKVQSYDLGTHLGTDVITGLNAAKYPCMRPYSPSTNTAQAITVYCNGDAEPVKITAVNSATGLGFNAGGWPGTFNGKSYSKPKFCEPFGDRMVYAAFNSAATAYDVVISNQGNAEAFTVGALTPLATDAVAFTAPAILGPITGLKAFRPSNLTNDQIFLIGQRDGVSIITGTDTTNYRLDILTNQYGIINNRCWVEIYSDLVFLTTAGVYNFGALVQNLSSPAYALTRDVQDWIQQIDFNNAAGAFAVHHSLTQEVQFWFPTVADAGVNGHALIMCYNTDSPPGTLVPVWSTKDCNGLAGGITAGIDFRNIMYGGDNTGHVQQHYNGDTYNGVQPSFAVTTCLMGVNLVQGGRMKAFSVVTDGGAQSFQMSAYSLDKFMDRSTRKSLSRPNVFTVKDLAANITRLPFTLGQSNFPADGVKVHTFSPRGRGRAWELQITSSPDNTTGLDYSGTIYTMSVGGFVR